jgi:hypothetical protein
VLVRSRPRRPARPCSGRWRWTLAKLVPREVLVGVIEEYARHMGRVDLLRERIDGRIGQ